jgi:hypothetical protein
VTEDPLKSALKEISTRLEPGLEPILAALRADESLDDAWETLLQEVLDEA